MTGKRSENRVIKCCLERRTSEFTVQFGLRILTKEGELISIV